LRQALESVPLDDHRISRLNIMHSGGVWDWAPELRVRFEGHPKVTIHEDPAPLRPIADTTNAAFGKLTTRWALVLHDDDFLLPRIFSAALAQLESVEDTNAGLVSFGWHSLIHGRHLRESARLQTLPDTLRFTPKFCSTLFNVERVQSIGGFAGTCGGFLDLVAVAELAHRFGAWISPTPVAVFRVHGGQASANRLRLYLPYLGHTIQRLLPLVSGPNEAEATLREMNRFIFSRRPVVDRVLGRLCLWSSRSVPPRAAPVKPLTFRPGRSPRTQR